MSGADAAAPAGLAGGRGRAALAAGIAALLSGAAIVGLHQTNPRTFASWHGLLHSGIAERIAASGIPPENPFFAGEPLPYYWTWHALAAGLSGLLAIDPLTAFQWLTLASLALVWFAGVRIGVTRPRVLGGGVLAGLLVGWLVLAGSDPVGPLLAGFRWVASAITLWDPASGAVETVRVSNEVADRWMTHPLVGALFWSWDWRIGPNAVWFWDNSSRATSLALLLPLAGLVLGDRPRAAGLIGATLLTAAVAALNPVVGVGAGLSLAGAAVVIGLWRDERSRLLWSGAGVLGLVLAAPVYLHLAGGETGGVELRLGFARALVAVGFAMAPIWLLAGGGAVRAARLGVHGESILFLAGTVLLGGALLLHLAEGNEHNLVNAALVLLAPPAAVWAMKSRWRSASIAIVFAPIVVTLFLAFTSRPDIPLATEGRRLERTDGIEAAYAWIRSETPADAVIIGDPDRPLRMSGNVSEVPAFTGRALWVDHPSYLTKPYADEGERARIARKLLAGQPLHASERARILALGRPTYLLRVNAEPSDEPSVVFEAHGITIQTVP